MTRTDHAPAAQHTPGPWKVAGYRDDADGLCVVQKSTGGLICFVETTLGQAAADEANSRLIATAPAQTIVIDLLRYGLATVTDGDLEFDGVMYWFDDQRPDWAALVDAIGWDYARAAIAKAKGGAQ